VTSGHGPRDEVMARTTGSVDSRDWRADGLARAVPFGLYIGFLALTPWLSPLMSDARWLYAVQIGLVALTLGFFWRRYSELAMPFAIEMKEAVLAVAIGLAVFGAWINLDLPWLAREAGKGFNPSHPDGSLSWDLIVLRIAGASIVIPVMEELFWRGFVLRWFDRSDFTQLPARAISTQAVWYCAIPFGLEHSLWFAGFLAGLAYGWLYRRTGKLWTAIIAHGLTNLLLGIWIVTTGNWSFW
jgi:CAAX prenyl protease-like protein